MFCGVIGWLGWVGLGWVAHNIGRGNPVSLLLTVRFANNSFDLR